MMQMWRIVATVQGGNSSIPARRPRRRASAPERFTVDEAILRLLKHRYRASPLATRRSQIGRQRRNFISPDVPWDYLLLASGLKRHAHQSIPLYANDSFPTAYLLEGAAGYGRKGEYRTGAKEQPCGTIRE